MSKHVREKCGNFEYSKFTKRHNSNKNWSKMTTLKLALWYIKTKSYTKFELNMSKHVEEKCGKLHICKEFEVKKEDNSCKKWRNVMAFELDLTCIKIKWYTIFEINMSKHVGEKCGKLWRMDGWMDGRRETRTDGHHHTIIRPVWRRAYKKLTLLKCLNLALSYVNFTL